MTQTLKIASAQLNAHVGALSSNMDKAREAYARAKADGADILVCLSNLLLAIRRRIWCLSPLPFWIVRCMRKALRN